jgi:flagellar biosynthesis/type III secretory pathway protein FliH
MNNSMKLSYDMIFANGADDQNGDATSAERPSSFSAEEVDEMLQERDDQWKQRLVKECDEARESGFAAGYDEGETKAGKVYEKQLAGLEAMMNDLDSEIKGVFDELKPHIAGLVFSMTEKVLDVPFEDERLQQRVQEEVIRFVENLDEALQVRVKVSEADYERVRRALDGKVGIENVSLRIDETQKSGEYAIETKKEFIIKNFKKMVADFKESISFAESGAPEFES